MDEKQLIEKGKELFNKGMFLQAIEYFQVVIEGNSNYAEAYLLLSDSYSKIGKDTTAKATVYKLLSKDPNNKDAIDKIKSLDVENYSNGVSPSSSAIKTSNDNQAGFKVESGSGKKTDYDIYLRFDDGNIVVLNTNGSNATVVGSNNLTGKLYLPQSVELNGGVYYISRIGDDAFSGRANLREVYLPNTVQEIGDGAFEHCYSLRLLSMGNGIKKIGDKAFHLCSRLKEMNLPTTITSIGNECFSWCQSLKTVVIPDCVEEIGRGAFMYCDSLEKVTMSSGIKSLNSNAFCHCGTPSIYMGGLPPKIESDTFSLTEPIIIVPRSLVTNYENAQYWWNFQIIGQ